MELQGLKDRVREKLRNPWFYRVSVLLVLAAVAFMLLGDFFVVAGLAAASMVLAWLIAFADLRRTGVELTTFTVLTIGAAYGPETGALAGFLLILGQLTIGQHMGVFIIWVVPSYAVIGALAGIIGASTIATTAIAMVVGMHVVFSLLTLLVSPSGFSRYIPYALGNVVFNSVLLVLAMDPVLSLVA